MWCRSQEPEVFRKLRWKIKPRTDHSSRTILKDAYGWKCHNEAHSFYTLKLLINYQDNAYQFCFCKAILVKYIKYDTWLSRKMMDLSRNSTLNFIVISINQNKNNFWIAEAQLAGCPKEKLSFAPHSLNMYLATDISIQKENGMLDSFGQVGLSYPKGKDVHFCARQISFQVS